MKQIREAALRYRGLGLSPIPVFGAMHHDETKRKRSAVQWKPYQDRIATEQEIDSFFRNGADVAVVCGAVSGGVEVIDFDAPELFEPFMDVLRGHDSQLAEKLVTQTTPSGGYHLLYRCKGKVPGNQKLARANDGKTVKIETRGTGGYFLIYPSIGYKLKEDISQLPVLTKHERNLLIWVAQSFDEAIQTERPQEVHEDHDSSGDRPGDVFNRLADWDQLLREDGWSYINTVGGREHWRRPDKKQGSTSATLHPEYGLYVFSSNTPLPTEQPLNPFGYITYMRFQGDFSAAARYVKDTYPEHYHVSFVANVANVAIRTQAESLSSEIVANDVAIGRSISSEVRDWVSSHNAPFSNKDLYSDLYMNSQDERKAARQTLLRMQKEGKISSIEHRRGGWEVVEDTPEIMDLLSADTTPINIPLPLGICDKVTLRQGAVILVAGSPNAGKTLFL